MLDCLHLEYFLYSILFHRVCSLIPFLTLKRFQCLCYSRGYSVSSRSLIISQPIFLNGGRLYAGLYAVKLRDSSSSSQKLEQILKISRRIKLFSYSPPPHIGRCCDISGRKYSIKNSCPAHSFFLHKYSVTTIYFYALLIYIRFCWRDYASKQFSIYFPPYFLLSQFLIASKAFDIPFMCRLYCHLHNTWWSPLLLDENRLNCCCCSEVAYSFFFLVYTFFPVLINLFCG